MGVNVLGPITVDGGTPSPRERSVLAALVVRFGGAVSPDELAHALWGDTPPATWPKQVQAAVGRVRGIIGARAITTGPAGYRLDIDPESVDAVRFERLLSAGTAHRLAGDPERAIVTLDRAVALWRGYPYADLPSWQPAADAAQRLVELLRDAEEELLAAHLDAGEHRSVVIEAESMVREQPLRERRWSILALALYQSSRQADALATIRAARERLADELGIDPGPELIGLEAAILAHDPNLDAPQLPMPSDTVCPYKGLSAYGVDDEDYFFGRAAEIQAALARIDSTRFTAFTGPSGCGKSSLLRAGVVPALRRRGRDTIVVTPATLSLPSLRDAAKHGRLVVIDQFEELFHREADDERSAEVCAWIADAVAAGSDVVVVVRSDYLDECASEPHVGPLMAVAVHVVLPMGPASLRSAIEEPARLAALRLESGLTELILRDATGEPGALPHLSHALVETWARREGSVLTVQGYESSGGISGSIAQAADRMFESLDAAERAICRSTMLRLVRLDTDGSAVRRHLPARNLRDGQAREHVIDRLTRARLVRVEDDTIAVTHESIASAWPRLHDWLEEDADSARAMDRLSEAADSWQRDGASDEDLWRGARLRTAEEWVEATEPDLTGLERAFLDASGARERREHDELVHRAHHERRQNRRLRGLLVATSVLLVGSLVAAFASYLSSEEAARQRDAATASAIATTSIAMRSSERDVAALLAAEAYHRWPDDARARSALFSTFTRGDGFLGNTYIPGTEWIGGDPIPGTDSAVLVVDDGSAGVYDMTTGVRERKFSLPSPAAVIGVHPTVRVSADGRKAGILRTLEATAPSGSRSGVVDNSELLVIDIDSGRIELGPIDLGVGGERFDFDPLGRYVAVATNDGPGDEFAIVDLRTGALRRSTVGSTYEPPPPGSFGMALAFTPDGRLVIGNVGKVMSIIDPVDLRVLAQVAVPPLATNVDMTVTKNGTIVAAGDRSMVAVDSNAGRLIWAQEFTSLLWTPCTWLAASDATGTIYCGNLWGRLEERSLATGTPNGIHRDPQLGLVGRLIIGKNDTELTAIGAGAPAISRWRLDGSGPITSIIAHGSVLLDGYDPSGTMLLTAVRPPGAFELDSFQQFSVWNPNTDEEILAVPGAGVGLAWAGPSLISGYFQTNGRLAFFDTDAEDFVTGDPIPQDAHTFWVDASATRVYLARPNGSVVVFDTRTRKIVPPTIELARSVTSGSSSADGSLVVMTSWESPQVYRTDVIDGATGEHLASRVSGSGVVAVRDDREVLASGVNRIVRYSLPDLRPIGSLPGVGGGLGGLQISADGRTMIAAAWDETVSVYDLDEGIRLGDPVVSASPRIRSAYLRPDGKELAVNVANGVAVWNLDPRDQVGAACLLAGRDLTREEWTTYFPDSPYHSTCGYDGAG